MRPCPERSNGRPCPTAHRAAAHRWLVRTFSAGLVLLATAGVTRAADDPNVTPFTEAASAPPPLVVHGWGTLTSLQDEDGRSLESVNVEDQPLPAFVESVGTLRPYADSPLPIDPAKGIPLGHAAPTLSLEPLVLCFHRDFPVPQLGVRVKATFHGGWLTGFYPHAAVIAGPATQPEPSSHAHLIDANTVGVLEWSGMQVGPGDSPSQPADGYPAWLAARAARAAMVTGPKAERERFIYYGGVARLDALLRVRRDAARDTLMITGRPPEGMPGAQAMHVRELWLVDVRADKALAYRSMSFGGEAAELGRMRLMAGGHFAATEYEPASLERLKKLMGHALTFAGLSSDEAAAVIESSKASYFERPGQRLLYLVPEAWADAALPLEISPHPGEVTRVLVGLIELITPAQRKLLATIAAGPVPGPPAPAAGPVQQAYAELGRFRQALVLDEAGRRPTPQLTAFMNQSGLQRPGVPQ